MSRVMLDANTFSYAVRGRREVVARLVAEKRTLCISTVSEGEIRYGLARRPPSAILLNTISQLLDRVEILHWTSQTAQRYGLLRAELERNGLTLASLDLMIAAHALEAGAILATSDRAFSGVPGLETVDWTLP